MKYTKVAYSYGLSDMPASVFGEWSVHRSPDYPFKGYRVTHAPSGYGTWTLADSMTKRDALKIAKLLADRVPTVRLIPVVPVIEFSAPFKMQDEDGWVVIATFAEVLGA